MKIIWKIDKYPSKCGRKYVIFYTRDCYFYKSKKTEYTMTDGCIVKRTKKEMEALRKKHFKVEKNHDYLLTKEMHYQLLQDFKNFFELKKYDEKDNKNKEDEMVTPKEKEYMKIGERITKIMERDLKLEKSPNSSICEICKGPKPPSSFTCRSCWNKGMFLEDTDKYLW